MADFKGIILRSVDYSDSSKIYTIFTREFGKVSCAARGVKSAKSKLSGILQPFTYCEISTIKGKGKLPVITSASAINSYYDLRLDLDRLNAACYFAKLIYTSAEENDRMPLLFDFFLSCLDLLCLGEDPLLLSRHFEANMLAILGYTPIITNCISCGSTGSSLFNNTWLYFDIDSGGVICPDCFEILSQKITEESSYKYKKVATATIQIIYFMLTGQYEHVKKQKLSEPLKNDLKNLLEILLKTFINSTNF